MKIYSVDHVSGSDGLKLMVYCGDASYTYVSHFNQEPISRYVWFSYYVVYEIMVIQYRTMIVHLKNSDQQITI